MTYAADLQLLPALPAGQPALAPFRRGACRDGLGNQKPDFGALFREITDKIRQTIRPQLWNAALLPRGKAMRDLLPSDLSTGMKRSVAIARALSAQPECILYDEPTTMVDPLMVQLLGDLIQKLKHQLKLTSIVVTHDMRLAKKLADRIVFLHEARAIFVGSVHEMERAQEEVVQEFLKLDELIVPGRDDGYQAYT